eukprot:1012602-Rhodomonas_salina.1
MMAWPGPGCASLTRGLSYQRLYRASDCGRGSDFTGKLNLNHDHDRQRRQRTRKFKFHLAVSLRPGPGEVALVRSQ